MGTYPAAPTAAAHAAASTHPATTPASCAAQPSTPLVRDHSSVQDLVTGCVEVSDLASIYRDLVAGRSTYE